jgi:hypothetical protein
MAPAPSELPVPAAPRCHLQRLEDDLASLSARLDACVDDPALGDGLAAMGLDQASQAIHRALIEVRDCVRASGVAAAASVRAGS